MQIDRELINRVETAVALDNSAIAERLGKPSQQIGDGLAVLMGPGFYVNRVFGFGMRSVVLDEHLETLERMSSAVGVPPEIAACPWADQSLLEVAGRRGYQALSPTSVLAITLETYELTRDQPFEIVTLDAGQLAIWQDLASRGFGYTSPEEREVSDAFVSAAARVPEIQLLIASTGGLAIAASSLSVRDSVAILGGMSTDPAYRGRGAQLAMIHHRLSSAADTGCDLAISTAQPGSRSERNLLRAGFRILYTQVQLTNCKTGNAAN